MKVLRATILAFSICILLQAQGLSSGMATNDVQINSLIVDGKQKPLHHGKSTSLGSSPQNVIFNFQQGTNSGQAPFRIRFRLEGHENNWNQGGNWVYLAVRF